MYAEMISASPPVGPDEAENEMLYCSTSSASPSGISVERHDGI